MTTGQTANYADRIERAITLLEARVAAGEVPPLEDLASAAALSPYHFHRIFRTMTGETVGEAIARARIGGSLAKLDDGIMAATAQSGYATSQAYARAVRNVAGATPTRLRDDAQARERVANALARPARGEDGPRPHLAIEITSFAPLRLAMLRNVGDYAELNIGFGRLYEQLMAQVAPQDILGIYGVPHDDPRDVAASACRFDCAMLIGRDIADDGALRTQALTGGPAISMAHHGDYDDIHAAMDRMYAAAIKADVLLADQAPLIHYHHDPEETPTTDLRADVYLFLA